nr:helix-turn-helix transcriptional regulator [uncultured Butyricicoccus sp.]
MLLTEKLELLMKEKHLNKRILAHESGIPYTTITSLFSKGYENAKLSTLKGLANFFGVTLDSLCRDELDELVYKPIEEQASHVSPQEKTLLSDFHALNEQGQEKVCEYAADLNASGRYKKCSEPNMVQNA